MTTVADRLDPHVRRAFSGRPPLRLRAWDGSELGPADAPLVVMNSRRALRRLLWQPGELGLAEAYIAGDIDVDGDFHQALDTVWAAVSDLRPAPRLTVRSTARALGTALRLGAVGPRPPAPGARARLGGALHSKDRDRAAISHHYDLSNDFYALLLDPAMAYSCAYWARPESEDYGLAEAQRDKLELICDKLLLASGARLLDIGCGWGALALHAAEHRGALVTAVTLSAEQRDLVERRIRERGLEDRVQVHLLHYRDLDPQGGVFDAVTAIEMGEHVGAEHYPGFAATVHDKLRPGGRALIQQMSHAPGAAGGGAFIETYIAPDMHMRPLGDTLNLLEAPGLEVLGVQALREHYVRTIAVWSATLEERWDRFVELAGPTTARIWRLYLAGAGLAFAQRRMGVDQILLERPRTLGTR